MTRAGRLNLITPEKVLQGIAEVKEGKSFCLSLPLDYPGGNLLNPARHPPQRLATQAIDGSPRYLAHLSEANPDLTDVVCDDRVLIHTQYSTQWDALSHVGSEFDADGDGVAEVVFYNGWRGGEHIVLGAHDHDHSHGGECSPFEGAEAKRLGIEKMAERCVQGRAVLIDFHAIHGDAKVDIDFALARRGDARPERHGRGGRYGLLPYRLEQESAGDEPAADAGGAASFLRRAARAAIRDCWNGCATAASPPSSPTITPSNAIPTAPARAAARCCRCMSCACSSSASISANCGG